MFDQLNEYTLFILLLYVFANPLHRLCFVDSKGFCLP
jgi:hypothetical protein